MVRAVLFDFFGTLVEYEPDRTQLLYPTTVELLAGWGFETTHEEFVQLWDRGSRDLEDRTASSHAEFSMRDAVDAFCATSGVGLDPEQCGSLVDAFAREWRSHVVPVAGIESLLRALSGRFRLAIVSNTNDPAMVPAFLAELGVDDLFESVVLSVDHGFRKPHHSIYQAALDALDLASTDVAFVGDSFVADYAAPRELGMTAYLIDPADRHEVPRGARLQSVLDLGSRLL